MHPSTLYDIAVAEHARQTAQRSDDHLVAQRRRERPTLAARPDRRSRRRKSARPAIG